MNRNITINARWDDEAGVWLATSNDVAGLVVEADTWPAMIEEVRLVLPELLEVSGQASDELSLIFKAEEHLDLASTDGRTLSRHRGQSSANVVVMSSVKEKAATKSGTVRSMANTSAFPVQPNRGTRRMKC
jgi:uncharacterized protein DUF1902